MSFWDRFRNSKTSAPTPDAPPTEVAYRRMFRPTPSFFCVLLTGVFIDEKIGLEAQEMNRLVSGLPAGLQSQGPMWLNLYLSWVLGRITRETYGEEFLAQSIAAIPEISANISSAETRSLVQALPDAFAYWFPVFDACLAMPNEHDSPLDLREAPHHFIIAFAMLKHGPQGPLFLADDDAAQIAISVALQQALQARLQRFTRMVEMGAPIEEVT